MLRGISDHMKIVPDQIAPWIPGGLTSLGTDGFGGSDIRPRLRRFFEVDAEMAVIAVLYALSKKRAIEAQIVGKSDKRFKCRFGKKLPIRSYVEGIPAREAGRV